MNYIPPTSFYDIFPNDFLNWNFPPSVGNLAEGAPAGTPRYGFQYPGGVGPTPAPLTQAEAPAFQFPALVERTSSAGSSVALASLSSQSTPSGSSVPSSQDLAQLFQMQGVGLPASADAPTVKRRAKRTGPPRRRGPNKRRPGSGYVDMMSGLPEEVQNALQQEYADCCEIVRGKDPSTVQKHRFAKRHFNKVDPKYQPMLPAFTCPAFVGLHDKCKSAKAGRYDSTERHCNNCPGFKELSDNSQVDMVYPFTISKEEFDAVQKFRKTLKPGKEVDAPALVQAVILRLITMLTGTTRPSEPVASGSGSGAVHADAAPAAKEQPSPSPSPSAQPQQSEQPMPEEPIYGITGAGGAVPSQVAAPWLDNLGAFDTFAPGLLLEPPYRLYPANANHSAWPNVNHNPTAFGPFFDEPVPQSRPAA